MSKLLELLQLRNRLLGQPQTKEVLEKLVNVDLLIKSERSKNYYIESLDYSITL